MTVDPDSVVDWVVSQKDLRRYQQAMLYVNELVVLREAQSNNFMGRNGAEVEFAVSRKLDEVVEWLRT